MRRLKLKEKQKMIKHVGKHGDRKVAIIFREVPGEEHMCLVVYPETMQQSMHDSLMQAIESPEGQAATDLGNALMAKRFNDGTSILERIHVEGMMKKVQTEQVIVTPTPTSSVYLNEMNRIVNEMAKGEEAVQRLAELDADAGYTGKARRRDDYGRDVGGPGVNVPAPGSLMEQSNKAALAAANTQRAQTAAIQAPTSGALSDEAIASNMKSQAERMAAEAQSLLAESQRMQAEANEMMGIKEAPAKKKRGRPAKSKA
jgi:hypothetical protein